MARLLSRIKGLSPQRLFLLIALTFGLFFLFSIPALQGWDEATHFLRTYQVSEHDFFPDKVGARSWGGQLPVNVLQMNDAFLGDLVQSAKTNLHRSVHSGAYKVYIKTFTPSKATASREFDSSAVYSPIAYLSSAIAIVIARVLHLPLLSYIYLGRLAAFIVWLILMYYAIKRIPVGKWVLVALALLPTTLTLSVSLAPDALIIGCAALLTATFVDYTVKSRPFNKADLFLMIGLLGVLALTKQTYIVFAGLFLFLPMRVFESKKKYVGLNAAFIGIVIVLAGAWLLVTADITQNIHASQRPGLNVNPQHQATYIEHHPLNYLAIVGNRIFTNNTNPMYLQLTGFITWKGILLPQWIILLCYLNLIVALLYVNQEASSLKLTPNRFSRYGPLLIAAAMVAAIYTSLYLAFSLVGSTNIEGVQGRYFLPLIPLCIAPFLYMKRKPLVQFDSSKLPTIISGIAVLTLTVTVLTVIATNYIPDIFK